MNAPLKSRLEIDPAAVADDRRPRSAVTAMTGLCGLAGLAAWTWVSLSWGMLGPYAALVALVACGLPMVLWSLFVDKVHRNPSTGIDWDSPPRPWRDTFDISLAKIIGLWGIWAVIGCLYCIARWYWRDGYLFAMEVLGLAAGPLLALSVPYVFWLDRRLKEPRDGAWHFGQLLIGRGDRADRTELHHFYRAWAVKAFFLAFMLSIVPGNWEHAIDPDWRIETSFDLANWLVVMMFMIDVTFATVGYVLTLKPLDAHIRTANPFAVGWTAALICYPPFVLMGDGGPLDYHVGTAGDNGWMHWLADSPTLAACWGAWLVLLTAIYASATVAFGLRFSNLTHRGIITNGPYALSKHPAYLSKNLFWFSAVMPFLAESGTLIDVVRNLATMGFVAGVYYWRARTEERHLSADPAYRAYADWMERHGPIPRLLRKARAVWTGPAHLKAPVEQAAE